MDKLEWLARNLDEWYKGEHYVAYVEAEEIHWHPVYMKGFRKAQWETKRKELQL